MVFNMSPVMDTCTIPLFIRCGSHWWRSALGNQDVKMPLSYGWVVTPFCWIYCLLLIHSMLYVRLKVLWHLPYFITLSCFSVSLFSRLFALSLFPWERLSWYLSAWYLYFWCLLMYSTIMCRALIRLLNELKLCTIFTLLMLTYFFLRKPILLRAQSINIYLFKYPLSFHALSDVKRRGGLSGVSQ